MNRIRLLRMAVVCAIVLAPLGPRLVYQHNTSIQSPIRADAANYVASAYNLAAHGVYSSTLSPSSRLNLDFKEVAQPTPDKHREPGYPAFLQVFLLDL